MRVFNSTIMIIIYYSSVQVFITPFKEKQHIFIKTYTQVPIIIEFVFLLRTIYIL